MNPAIQERHAATFSRPEDGTVLSESGYLASWPGSGGNPTFSMVDSTGGAPYSASLNPLQASAFIGAPSGGQPDYRIAMALDLIRKTFGLNVSQLADVLAVQRRTLYQWKKGASPHDNNSRRVFELERAARSWAADGFPVPGVRLGEPLVGDRSILDLLSDNPIDLDAIHFAGGRLHLDASLSGGVPMKDPFG